MVTPTALLTGLAMTLEQDEIRLPADDLEQWLGYERLGAQEALVLGYQAGRAAARSRRTTSFLMDEHLVVRGAEGRSMLSLPWFHEDLFVSRQLPDIAEIPREIRAKAVTHYRAGLDGRRGAFEFTSHGQHYAVEVVPVMGCGGDVVGAFGLARMRPDVETRPLTAREREILQLAADGLSGPEIAERLVVSLGTVKTHFQNIYAKWCVSERAGAVAKALREGVID